MANLTSKLIVGGVVIVTLLMMFVPISAADYSYNADSNSEEIDVTSDSDDGGEGWDWDCDTCTLVLEDGLEIGKLTIVNSTNKTIRIEVNGTVKITNYCYLQISTDYETIITGGGKIVSDCGWINVYKLNTDVNAIVVFDNISLDLVTTNGGAAVFCHADIVFRNCPSVNLTGNANYAIIRAVTINTTHCVKVENSNLFVCNSGHEYLISTENGIYMPSEPSGEGLVYDSGVWQSGVTKTIDGPGSNCSLTMESYAPPEDSNDSINIYDVSLYSMIIAAIVLIAVGSVYAGKH